MNSNGKHLNIGIVGLGRMGITHYSILNSHPAVSIVGVAEPSKMITTFLGKYIPDVRIHKDYKDLFEQVNLDAVLVCTPPNVNHEIITAAAAKGLHVFVEKPFSTNTEHAKDMDRAYRDAGLVNQVGYVNRFNDVFTKVKEFVDEGVIGDVLRYRSEMFSCTITSEDNGSGWRMSRESGGGAVYEMASHAIDLVNFIIGKPDRVSGSALTSIYSQNVEDTVSSTFSYKNGIVGTIYINWSDDSYRKPTNKLEIFGAKGKILADQHSMKVFLKKENKERELQQGWSTLYITDIFNPVPFYVRGNEFTRQLYHFADSILDRSIAPVCNFNHGIETLEVIDHIFEDSEAHQLV